MKAIVDIFKSLADETRLRLLLLLQSRGELCVCDLMNALDMKQSAVSRHLAYLKKNGWLRDRRGGVWMYYSLKGDLSPLLQSELVLIIASLADSTMHQADLQRLNAYLATKDTASCS